MTVFFGTKNSDTIIPDFVSDGVRRIGPNAMPGMGDDVIFARSGDDIVAGGLGDDFAFLGAGDDIFHWGQADGSDRVYGQSGFDTLAFDGSDDGEIIDIFADGRDAALLRDVGDVRIDMETVERIDLSLFGGTDEVTIRNVARTSLDEVVIDLSGPDGAADFLIVEGTEGADDVTIDVEGDAIVVSGLSATVRFLGAENGLDQLLFRGFGGDDRVDASALAGIELSVQAGDGDDVLIGSAFRDRLSGDAGDDRVYAKGGDDILFGGAGKDVLDGGAGFDQLSGDARDEFRNGEIIFDGGLFA